MSKEITYSSSECMSKSDVEGRFSWEGLCDTKETSMRNVMEGGISVEVSYQAEHILEVY